MDFTGRAERETEIILNQLLHPTTIKPQVPLSALISSEEFNLYDEEIQKHKFDLVVDMSNYSIIVEVNYKHKEKAAKKWRTIFEPLLEKNNYKTLVINDYDCDTLFKPQDYTKHRITWDDFVDIINALKLTNIQIPFQC